MWKMMIIGHILPSVILPSALSTQVNTKWAAFLSVIVNYTAGMQTSILEHVLQFESFFPRLCISSPTCSGLGTSLLLWMALIIGPMKQDNIMRPMEVL